MQKSIYYLLLFYAAVCSLSIAYFNGTGDAGDSVTHYLFARYAPAHPQLYFDHWAKPLFVLLASPFAQAGFTGMKVFNSLLSLAIVALTYATAKALNMRNAIVGAVLLIFSPLYYILTFSGLTEYLFALLTILGLYLSVKENFLSAALVVSFLPYVRSEGLILIGVFTLFLLLKKQYRVLPWLLSGSLIYAIAGYFVYKDLLWVFTKIPYATLNSVYGSGGLFHFAEQLVNVTGVPVYSLFWLGCLALIFRLVRRGFDPAQHILVLGGFFCFFVAHSLFWYLGIFNSMGLKRVLISVMPLAALVALQGFNVLVEDLFPGKPRPRRILAVLAIGYVLIFPFTSNPSAIQWKKDMMLNPEQEIADKVAGFLRSAGKVSRPLLYNHRYLALPLQLDYFNPSVSRQISAEAIAAMKPGDVLIWDNIFGLSESRISRSRLDSMSQLKSLFVYSHMANGKEVVFSGYEKTTY